MRRDSEGAEHMHCFEEPCQRAVVVVTAKRAARVEVWCQDRVRRHVANPIPSPYLRPMASRGGGRAALRKLERGLALTGEEAARERGRCLAALESARLETAREVHRLHEALCFLRA